MRDFPLQTHDQLPQLLQAFRRLRGLTQKELAERLGITQQTLSQLERNAASASAARIFSLLTALDVQLVLRDALADEPADAKSSLDSDW